MGLGLELFEGEVPDDLICGICNNVLLEPVKNSCPHVFCLSCIKSRLKHENSRYCPTCNLKLNATPEQTTVEFKLQLLSLPIRCSHKCGHVCPLSELPDHISDECPNAPVECQNRATGCRKKVRRCDIQRHLEECDYREVECEACGFHTVFCELFTHQKRVRCLERKLKQQVIHGQRSTSFTVRQHQHNVQRQHKRLEQEQRKRILSHHKTLVKANSTGSLSPERSTEDVYTNGNVFLTETSHCDGEEVGSPPSAHDNPEEHGRAPHPSRAGNSAVICQNCRKLFKSDNNNETSCRWHAGPIIKVFGGTCYSCGRLDYQPGCQVGLHQP